MRPRFRSAHGASSSPLKGEGFLLVLSPQGHTVAGTTTERHPVAVSSKSCGSGGREPGKPTEDLDFQFSKGLQSSRPHES